MVDNNKIEKVVTVYYNQLLMQYFISKNFESGTILWTMFCFVGKTITTC